ncbi:hypothetical protein ACWDZ8_40625 [Streptomyces sp. NPDC003233]
MRVNHTYGRGGALAYPAAYDVHHAKVLGRTEPRTGIDPFMALVTQVMSQEPYASAKRVFWIVDNGSSHLRQRSWAGTPACPGRVAAWDRLRRNNRLGFRDRLPVGVSAPGNPLDMVREIPDSMA